MKLRTLVSIALCLSVVMAEESLSDEHAEASHSSEEEEDEKNPMLEQMGPPLKAFGFSDDPENDNAMNAAKVSEDLKVYEEEYKKCIADIDPEEFGEEKVEGCIGKRFIKVILDVKYETMKMMSRAETRLREFFVEGCYEPAEDDMLFAHACDLLEGDILELMWGGLDFVSIAELNKNKYLAEHAVMPRRVYKEVRDYLSTFSDEFFNVLEVIDEYKENMIMALKILIDEKKKESVEYAEKDHEVSDTSIMHNINVNESVKQPHPQEKDEVNDMEREDTPSDYEGQEHAEEEDHEGENSEHGIEDDRRLKKSNSFAARSKSTKQPASRLRADSSSAHPRNRTASRKPSLVRLLHGLRDLASRRNDDSKNIHTKYIMSRGRSKK